MGKAKQEKKSATPKAPAYAKAKKAEGGLFDMTTMALMMVVLAAASYVWVNRPLAGSALRRTEQCAPCTNSTITDFTENNDPCKLVVYRTGQHIPAGMIDLPDCKSALTADVIKMINRLGGPCDRYYTRYGSQIYTNYPIKNNEVWAVEVGQYFVWPTWEIGHTETFTIGSIKSNAYSSPPVEVTVTTQADRPRLFTIDGLLTEQECDHIISVGKPKMERSQVARNSYKGDGVGTDDVRTSDTAWIAETEETDILKTIRSRVEWLTGVPLKLAESMQVLHYEPGEYYYAHHDWFTREQHPDRYDLRVGRNRFMTFLFYLNDVEEGGETLFPRALDKSNAHNDKSCTNNGLKVAPKKGRVVLFYNLDAKNHMEGAGDVLNYHAACPVVKGEKWAANYWIYNMTPVTAPPQR
eukprot:GFYU01005444.1.p2 GENE.GFYU01005444.1~~GFYU01005444.1.p2  ORF type:complete len:410 (-),score=124.92 GFYU01005444.1:61-1290(-)